MTDRPPLSHEGQGKWRGILAAAGIDDRALSGRHCPCPKCGGTDRFRFDDKDGLGTWICSHCGAGDGPALLVAVKGWDFREVARFVRSTIGSVEADSPRPQVTEQQRRQGLRDLWKASQPVVEGDLVSVYLRDRGLKMARYPKDLRFAPRAYCSGPVKERPAMLAILRDRVGKEVTIHRTYLAENGRGKADMEAPRKLMAGQVPDDGVAVRLAGLREHIGVAEGIETALAAMALFRIPVWSVISTVLMERWLPPDGVKRVTIYGDHDENYAGHKAAYALAYRLSAMDQIEEVEVAIPPQRGDDWADVYAARTLSAAK